MHEVMYIPPEPGNLAATIGPYIVGPMLSLILLGVIIILTYTYYSLCPDDPLALKISVGCVCLGNVASAVFDAQIVWHFGITHFGDYSAVAQFPPLHGASLLLTGCVQAIVQGFFALRTWRAYDESRPLGFIFALLILISVAGAISAPSVAFARKVSDIESLVLVWLWAAAAADTSISGMLMYRLSLSRHDKELPESTRRVIDKVLLLALSTTLMTTVALVTDAIIILAATPTNVHSLFTMCIPRLYAITLLWTCTSRDKLRAGLDRSTLGPWRGSTRWTGRRTEAGASITRSRQVESQDPARIGVDLVQRRPPVGRQNSNGDVYSPKPAAVSPATSGKLSESIPGPGETQ